MKNLQTYADRPATEFPEFWTEEWLKIAIDELDTRRFSAEQYERYAVTLARNASAIQMDQIKMLKVQTEVREKVQTEERAKAEIEKEALRAKAEAKEEQMILEMHEDGMNAAKIAKFTQKTALEVQAIIKKYEK